MENNPRTKDQDKRAGLVIGYHYVGPADENNNCDGSGPHKSGEVRVLPTGGDSNAILCKFCFDREMRYRRARNLELASDSLFELPNWGNLKVYDAS